MDAQNVFNIKFQQILEGNKQWTYNPYFYHQDNVMTPSIGYVRDDIVAVSDFERGKCSLYFLNTSDFAIEGKVMYTQKIYSHYLKVNETILLAAGLSQVDYYDVSDLQNISSINEVKGEVQGEQINEVKQIDEDTWMVLFKSGVIKFQRNF